MGTSERKQRVSRFVVILGRTEVERWSGESGQRITEQDKLELMLDTEERYGA